MVVAIDSSFDKIPSLQIRRLVTSIVKLRLNELRLVKGGTSFQNLKLRSFDTPFKGSRPR